MHTHRLPLTCTTHTHTNTHHTHTCTTDMHTPQIHMLLPPLSLPPHGVLGCHSREKKILKSWPRIGKQPHTTREGEVGTFILELPCPELLSLSHSPVLLAHSGYRVPSREAFLGREQSDPDWKCNDSVKTFPPLSKATEPSLPGAVLVAGMTARSSGVLPLGNRLCTRRRRNKTDDIRQRVMSLAELSFHSGDMSHKSWKCDHDKE